MKALMGRIFMLGTALLFTDRVLAAPERNSGVFLIRPRTRGGRRSAADHCPSSQVRILPRPLNLFRPCMQSLIYYLVKYNGSLDWTDLSQRFPKKTPKKFPRENNELYPRQRNVLICKEKPSVDRGCQVRDNVHNERRNHITGDT